MSTQRCTYCKDPITTRPPAEHVLPQMFGTFEDNLTLFCVCGPCNNSFSKLELFLGRDSAEAIQRLRFGLKPPVEAKKIRGRRLVIRANQPGDWFGAFAVLDGDDEVFPTFLPQAAFRASPSDEWEWILASEFSSERLAAYPVASAQIRVAGGSNKELMEVADSLERLGYKFGSRNLTEVPGGEDGKFRLRVEGVVDEPILRAIAKVGFNYFAYTNGPDAALREEFDPIRNFIRHGKPAGFTVVEISDRPILENERGGRRITDGHLLTVGWGASGALPVAKVAFFNAITYVVHLSEKLDKPLTLERSGHHLHPKLRRIEKLSLYRPRKPG